MVNNTVENCIREPTIIIIIIIKTECHSNIIVDRLQGCGHSKKAAGKWKRVTQQ